MRIGKRPCRVVAQRRGEDQESPCAGSACRSDASIDRYCIARSRSGWIAQPTRSQARTSAGLAAGQCARSHRGSETSACARAARMSSGNRRGVERIRAARLARFRPARNAPRRRSRRCPRAERTSRAASTRSGDGSASRDAAPAHCGASRSAARALRRRIRRRPARAAWVAGRAKSVARRRRTPSCNARSAPGPRESRAAAA